MRIPYILTLATLLLLTTWTSATGKPKGFDPEDNYRFSIGIDVAKPFLAYALNQNAMTFYGHYGFSKYFGTTVNFGFENAPLQLLDNNVYTSYQSQFFELWLDIKPITKFWMSGGLYFGSTTDEYEATLQQVNFYPVTRNFTQTQGMFGAVARMSYYENLTDRIAVNVLTDIGFISDLSQEQFRSLSSPGFLAGASRTLYANFGIHLGYRFGLRQSD